MKEQKRHHYVPQFYLKGFADEHERVWVYDRVTQQFRHQKTDQIAVIGHYYRIEKRDGSLSVEVEQYLSEVEGDAAFALNKLDKHESITQEEKIHIAVYIALQMTRVPDYEKRVKELQEKSIRRINKMLFSSVEAAKEKIEESREELGKLGKEADAEELFRFVQEDQYKLDIPRQNTIRSMLDLAGHIVPYFMQMDWNLLRATKGGAFITTDNPFTLVPPSTLNPSRYGQGIGIITPGAMKMIPLSSQTCLVMGNQGDSFQEIIITKDRLRPFNIFSAVTSDRFIFAKDEALLRSVVERSAVNEIPVIRERVSIT
ncbi:MAG: hypothetical protein JWO43_611 [Candidatus Adlerbacteria bacterium]|nr:hypothetical protein [Candidatus Adlerbacteria bacterium]